MTLKHGGVMLPKHTHADVLKSGKEAWLRAMCGFCRSAGSIPVVGTIGMWLSLVRASRSGMGKSSVQIRSSRPSVRGSCRLGARVCRTRPSKARRFDSVLTDHASLAQRRAAVSYPVARRFESDRGHSSRVRLAVKDKALSRPRSRVQIPHARLCESGVMVATSASDADAFGRGGSTPLSRTLPA
jgi:hypothetical protein